jgi:CheY-like chemotaxis protein
LVVLDVVMPKLAGPEALKRMRALQPTVKALFVTGHAPEASQFSADLAQPGLDLMRKPFTQSELAVRVQKALKN